MAEAKKRPSRGRKRAASSEPLPSRPCATAADLADEPVSFLWNRRVPENDVTLLAGPGEHGKSTIATAIAAAVTSGGQMPGGPWIDPGAVLWFGAEERGGAIIRPRLRLAGAVLARVYLPDYGLDGKPRKRLRLPRDTGLLADLIGKVHARLVVFDPITSYIDEGANPDHGSIARSVLQSLADVCHELRCACICIKHPKKFTPGQSAIEQISGSREWTHLPRAVLLVAPHPDRAGSSCLVSLKGSIRGKAPTICYRIDIREELPLILWESEEDLQADALLEASGTPADRDTLADAKMLLMDRLSEGEQKAKDVLQWAVENAIPPHTLRKAKKLLGVTSHTIGNNTARFHVWRPPDGGFPTPGA